MAEIKSTLEMVMERAAKMEAAAQKDLGGEEKVREGMRQAAGFMRGELSDMAEIFAKSAGEDHADIRKGMVQTFLRNIVLPRDEDQGAADKAIQGLMQLGKESGDLGAVFAEMKKVLEQYVEHNKQLRQQLEDSFAAQVQQMEQALAQQTGMAMKVTPSQHPKFQEEWARIKSELNDQYGRALDQYKQLIEQKLV